jgi:hypothetical protein
MLAGPADGAVNQRDTVTLKWDYTEGSAGYNLIVSADPAFKSNIIYNESGLQDTSTVVTGFTGLSKYYWRIKASNAAGEGSFSEINSFTTGFPTAPSLISPAHATTGVSMSPNLVWSKADSSESYELQLSNSLTFNESTILFDTTGISDTTVTLSKLLSNTIYFWRVRGNNAYGAGNWSGSFGFKTLNYTFVDKKDDIPTKYKLKQNYPNPFNPTTRISFDIPRSGLTTLKVYDVLGNEVADLVNESLSAGSYSVSFDGSGLSSGMYIYILRSGEKVFSRKMILIK